MRHKCGVIDKKNESGRKVTFKSFSCVYTKEILGYGRNLR
jgi:hypothetical protein